MNKILLVEDEPFNQTVIEDIFEYDDVPAQLVCVESGEEALEIAFELQPMLILMDVGLPGIDGHETTRRLRKDPRTHSIDVWALTAHAMKDDGEKSLAAGCSAYFTKPLDAKEFLKELLSYIQRFNSQECQPCQSC